MRWLILPLILSACTVPLKDCTLDVSRSGKGDALSCSNHRPIPLQNVDPALRKCVLEAKP